MKLSQIKKQMYKDGKIKLPYRKGIPHTLEVRERIMKNLRNGKRFYKGMTTWNKGKKCPYASKIFKELRSKQIFPIKDTSIEIKIQNYLRQLNIEFFTHQRMKINHAYQCDIFIPSKNLIVECDGDYWHSYPIGKEIDHIRTRELIENGFKVLRLWERHIKILNLKNFEEILKNV